MPHLTQQQREQIYDLKGKTKAYKVANTFDVSPTTIYNIWKGTSPISYRRALRRIESSLNRLRGYSMTDPVLDEWAIMYKIVTEALTESGG